MQDVTLAYDRFDPASEGLREALTSTGNGYFCTRGTAEWEDAGTVHYPGTYAHGGFNRETTILGGRPVLNEDLVNLPNWLVLKLRIEGADAIRLDNVELLSYRHDYDIRRALVRRELCFRDLAGRETTLRSRRFVSMADSHQAGIEWILTPQNWSGRMEVVSALDGRVTNQMVARYRELEGRHLNPVSPRTFGPQTIALKVQTRQSNIYIAEAARTRVFRGDGPAVVERSLYQMEDYIQQVLAFDVTAGEPVRVEKLVALFTSHDNAITEPLAAAGRHVLRYPDFAAALAEHEGAWTELWDICDVQLPREPRVQLLLRFHTAHVLQVCSRHTARHDAGVPARGLNGEAYRGHVFWDELYVYPFLNFRLPEITRGLLLYRYRRLSEARAAAREAGYRGAMFPWQSGSDGTEETQVVHLNPLSGQWEPDHSHNQRHVNAAIFYNVWQYYQATDDLGFLRDYGAELMLEIARFWASIAHYNPERDRYEIHGVMGPDEFHERYPGADEAGLSNNAYTNVMAAWIAATALRVLDLLPAALRARRGVTDAELDTWRRMSSRMFVPFHDTDAGPVPSQFEGYADLDELDWAQLPRRAHQHPTPRPDPQGRRRRSRPLPGGQAGRHGDAVLPVLPRRAAPVARTARLRPRPGPGTADHRLLRPAHLARLDTEPDHLRRRARRAGSGQLMAAVSGGAGKRPRRRAGRHHQGRHPHGRHVRDPGPAAAQLRRQQRPRRRAALPTTADRPARRSRVLHAVPRDLDPDLDQGPRADRARPGRRLPRAGANRRRRPGSRAGRGRPLRVRAPTTARPDAPITHARPGRSDHAPPGFEGVIFDVDGVVVELATHEYVQVACRDSVLGTHRQRTSRS